MNRIFFLCKNIKELINIEYYESINHKINLIRVEFKYFDQKWNVFDYYAPLRYQWRRDEMYHLCINGMISFDLFFIQNILNFKFLLIDFRII